MADSIASSPVNSNPGSVKNMATTTNTTNLNWPLSFKNSTSATAGIVDLEEIADDFEREKERLFQAPDEDSGFDEMNVEGICAGNGGEIHYITDSDSLETFLESSVDDDFRIIFLNQTFSWGPIEIFPDCAQTLLSKVRVMPEFWNVLRAFGSKSAPVDESFGGLFCGDEDEKVTEFCYLVKHVEARQQAVVTMGANATAAPAQWANRQMGVYHQRRWNHISKSQDDTGGEERGAKRKCFDTFIIVNPAKAVRKLLVQMCSGDGSAGSPKPTPELVHTMIANTLTSKWKVHIGDIESELLIQINKAYLTSNERNDFTTFEFGFGDTQVVYDMRDKILRLDSLLDINDRVFSGLQKRLFQAIIGDGSHEGRKQGFLNRMEFIREETAQQKARLGVVLQRLEGCCAVIRNIMDLRLAAIQQDDNRIMTDLGTKSRQDAHTAKTLTVLALIFIPASFAAQVLSMGYISFGPDAVDTPTKSKIKFSWGLLAFLVLTLVCILITVGLWLYLQPPVKGSKIRYFFRSHHHRSIDGDEEMGEAGDEGHKKRRSDEGEDPVEALQNMRMQRRLTGF